MSLFKTYIETCTPLKSKYYNKNTLKRRFSRCNLPQNDSIAKNISFLTVILTCNDLWSHPLISSDFPSHIIIQTFGPSKIS